MRKLNNTLAFGLIVCLSLMRPEQSHAQGYDTPLTMQGLHHTTAQSAAARAMGGVTYTLKNDVSLMFTNPVDLLLGPSNAKFLWKDTGTTFFRVGFPLFDRHHLHKRPIIGYRGAENLLTDIVNTVLDEMDRASMNNASFDLVR